MTAAAELLADLRARGVTIRVLPAGRLAARPRERLTAADFGELAAQRAEIVKQLTSCRAGATGDTVNEHDDPPLAAGPCGLCRKPLSWVENWPTTGDGAWLCGTCAAWPPLALTEAWARLTGAEREQLQADAEQGDALAGVALESLPEGNAFDIAAQASLGAKDDHLDGRCRVGTGRGTDEDDQGAALR